MNVEHYTYDKDGGLVRSLTSYTSLDPRQFMEREAGALDEYGYNSPSEAWLYRPGIGDALDTNHLFRFYDNDWKPLGGSQMNEQEARQFAVDANPISLQTYGSATELTDALNRKALVVDQTTDNTEAFRRAEVAKINHEPGSREALEAEHGQVWDTQQLTTDFEVKGFMAPYISVVRKSDNQRGTLTFQHSPRFYWGFESAR